MKKLFLAFMLIFVFSCGSVKKDKKSIDIEKSSFTDTNSSSTTNRWIESANYTLEPVDLSQPILWTRNGKTDTIYNTKVIYNNTNTKETIIDTTKTQKKETEKVAVEEKHKETDNTFLILGIVGIGFLFLLIVVLVVFNNLSKKIGV